jgi:predicted aminopeptidase
MKEKINQLVDRLTVLPEEISDLQVRALATNDSIQEIAEEILTLETEIKTEISTATDENGKKLYSNDDARKAAFLADSRENPKLRSLYTSKKEESNKLEVVRIAIDRATNEQRNIRSILSIIKEVEL